MITKTEKLYIDVTVRGAQKAVADLRRIAQARSAAGGAAVGGVGGGVGVRPTPGAVPVPRATAPAAAGGAAAGAGAGRPRPPAAGGVGAGAGRFLGGAGRTVLGLAGIGGAAALVGLAREASAVSASVTALGTRLGLGADGVERLKDSIRSLSDATGESQAVLAGAIRTATDFGASLKQATDSMQELETLSRLWAVDLGQTSEAFGVVAGANPNATGDQNAALLKAMVEGSGLQETAALDLIKRLMPQMGVLGGSAQDQAGVLTGLMRAGGENLVGDPERLKELMKGIVRAFSDPKAKQELEALGIAGESAAEIIQSMAGALAEGKVAFDELPPTLRPLAEAMAASDTFLQDFMSGLTVSTMTAQDLEEAMRKAVEAAPPDEMKTAWQRLKNDLLQLGEVLAPLISAIVRATTYILSELGDEIGGDLRRLVDPEEQRRQSMITQGEMAERRSESLRALDYETDAGSEARGREYVRNIRGMDMGDQVGPMLRLLQDIQSGAVSGAFARGAKLELNVTVNSDGVRATARDENGNTATPTTNVTTTPGRP